MRKFYTFKLNVSALTARLLKRLELPKWDGGCMQHESYFIIIPNDKSKGGLQETKKIRQKHVGKGAGYGWQSWNLLVVENKTNRKCFMVNNKINQKWRISFKRIPTGMVRKIENKKLNPLTSGHTRLLRGCFLPTCINSLVNHGNIFIIT